MLRASSQFSHSFACAKQVYMGANGVLAGLSSAGALLIDSSTIDPLAARAVSVALHCVAFHCSGALLDLHNIAGFISACLQSRSLIRSRCQTGRG